MYEPPDAKCADGSPYRFFVNFSDQSNNVVIFFEGGGACWDYASCSADGARSAANRSGISETHATVYTSVSNLPISISDVYPIFRADEDVTPTYNWNKVFVPYCTGDVYTGSVDVMYSSADSTKPDLPFSHRGRDNVLAMLDMLEPMVTNISKLLVGGCSAGGVGATFNYDAIRSRLNPRFGYLLNDSGPIFPSQESTSRSHLLYARARKAWQLDQTLAQDPNGDEVMADFGAINTVLAERYPDDRLAITYFQLDYNFSLYSYERFYTRDEDDLIITLNDGSGLFGVGLDEFDPKDRTATYQLWADDTSLLRAQYDSLDNLGYYMPFYRTTSDSHCLILTGFEEVEPSELPQQYFGNFPSLAWMGTELDSGTETINVKDYLSLLLDNTSPLQSFFEDEAEGQYRSCVPQPEYYDEALCAEASQP